MDSSLIHRNYSIRDVLLSISNGIDQNPFDNLVVAIVKPANCSMCSL